MRPNAPNGEWSFLFNHFSDVIENKRLYKDLLPLEQRNCKQVLDLFHQSSECRRFLENSGKVTRGLDIVELTEIIDSLLKNEHEALNSILEQRQIRALGDKIEYITAELLRYCEKGFVSDGLKDIISEFFNDLAGKYNPYVSYQPV